MDEKIESRKLNGKIVNADGSQCLLDSIIDAAEKDDTFPNASILPNLWTFFVAGHDTTAVSWSGILCGNIALLLSTPLLGKLGMVDKRLGKTARYSREHSRGVWTSYWDTRCCTNSISGEFSWCFYNYE